MDQKRIQLVLDWARCIADEHGLSSDWSFKIDRSKTRAGVCLFGKKTISFSKYMILSSNVSMDQIKNIVLHEIAHALVGFEAGHGEVWKNKALEIGCDGKRCHSLFFATPKVMSCPCGACKFSFHRMNKKAKLHLGSVCMICLGNILVKK